MKEFVRILALALCLCLISSLLPPVVTEAATVNDLTYTVSNKEVTITGCDQAASGRLVIPSKIGSYPVTAIGNHAFDGCAGLTDVVIPKGVYVIGDFAFLDCSGLTSVSIPKTVHDIGRSAFIGCSSLTGFTVAADNPDFSTDAAGVLFSLGGDYLDCVPGGISGHYVIPEGTVTIGYAAFGGCQKLTGVTIPESVRKLGYCTFQDCSGLTSVIIPGSVREIGYDSFRDCSLKTVYFTGNAPSFGGSVFYGNDADLYYHAGTTGWDSVTSEDLVGWEGEIRLHEVAHVCTEYTYDNNHTCTKDGTERGLCLTCGKTDVRKVPCSATHAYQDGVCSICGENDPEIYNATVTGTLTTSGEGDARLTLTPVGEDAPAATLTTADGTYSLAVPEGEYILTVSAEGYVPRSYPLTLVKGETTLDVKLHLPGDINGDGKINVADVSKAYAHTKRFAFLEDYAFQVCDVTGEGRISVADVSKLYAHAKKTAYLW